MRPASPSSAARWSAHHPEPIPFAPQQPVRRARRPDVARRCARPLGARLPHGAIARADRLLALLASALLLAGESRVHAGARAGVRRCDGPPGAGADDRVPDRSRHRRADGPELPDRRGARPRSSEEGYCIPGGAHIAAGSIAMQKGRQRMAEILGSCPAHRSWSRRRTRIWRRPRSRRGSRSRSAAEDTRRVSARPCSSLPPTTSPRLWTAASPHSSYTPTAGSRLRARLRRYFGSYNELANGVLAALSLEMPAIDLDSLRAMPMPQRRPITRRRPSASSDCRIRGVERRAAAHGRDRSRRAPAKRIPPPSLREWRDRGTRRRSTRLPGAGASRRQRFGDDDCAGCPRGVDLDDVPGWTSGVTAVRAPASRPCSAHRKRPVAWSTLTTVMRSACRRSGRHAARAAEAAITTAAKLNGKVRFSIAVLLL